MTKKILIDAAHDEEIRLAVIDNEQLSEFDYEAKLKKPTKGNIYLAKVTRVEPSLQAAFVDYGAGRQGFLAFSEIHSDYYRIPVADRAKLEQIDDDDDDDDSDDNNDVETLGNDDITEHRHHRKKSYHNLRHHYKIQEVIKHNQVMLVQVVREERGNKGAAVTTFLSLAGRYSVLMPNTGRGSGISRKINDSKDRKRLKEIVEQLNVPDGMTVILRTAGAQLSAVKIKRDYQYICKIWDNIRNKTLDSVAPCLIAEEADIIHRALRDIYNDTVDEVIVEGDDAYKRTKTIMKGLTPSHVNKVKKYKKESVLSLFAAHQVNQQLQQIQSPHVSLSSGGYVILHQTEALVAIDVNSGKATKERHIEETALKTNLEAAEEIARQLRLRDLAGLVVIDFIDMEENANNIKVEKRLKEFLNCDRARIQIGRISSFGLLEMSRQRLRPSLQESMGISCPYCSGHGYIPSRDFLMTSILRHIEQAFDTLQKDINTADNSTQDDDSKTNDHKNDQGRMNHMTLTMHLDNGSYLLNEKRKELLTLEEYLSIPIKVIIDSQMSLGEYIAEIVFDNGQTRRLIEQTHQEKTPYRHKKQNRNKRKQKNNYRDHKISADSKTHDQQSHHDDNDPNDNPDNSNDTQSHHEVKRSHGRKYRGNRRMRQYRQQRNNQHKQDYQSQEAAKNEAVSQEAKSITVEHTITDNNVTNDDVSKTKKTKSKKAIAKKAMSKKTTTKKAASKKVAAKKISKKASTKKTSKKAASKKTVAKKEEVIQDTKPKQRGWWSKNKE